MNSFDDHFRQILAPGKPKDESFISSKKFVGQRDGYYFGTGSLGTGYYLDPLFQAATGLESKKRNRVDDIVKDNITDALKKSKSNNIDALLEEADENEIAPLDATSLKQLLLQLDKKINRNQILRMKHYDEPELFMESEIELHSAISELNIVAASPELYPIIVSNNGITSLLGLITHENTDISLATIALFQEMLDADVLMDIPETKSFINTFISSQGLELIVQNLNRLNVSGTTTSSTTDSTLLPAEEDVQGVNNTLSIIENLIELDPSIAKDLCKRTHIFQYLLQHIRKRSYDNIKLYCSEILSILLQAYPSNQKRFYILSVNSSSNKRSTSMVSKGTRTQDCQQKKHEEDNAENGLDVLMESIAYYRKRDPTSMDEQECIHNLFVSLYAMLLHPVHQTGFYEREGIDLLLRCIQEQKYAALCAVKAINYAINKHTLNSVKFIELGGLKYIFPIVMGKGLPRSLSSTSTSSTSSSKGGKGEAIRQIKHKDILEAIELAIAILANLCIQIHFLPHNSHAISSSDNNSSSSNSNSDGNQEHIEIMKECGLRLLAKFIDNKYEKMKYMIFLFDERLKRLVQTEEKIEKAIEMFQAAGDEDVLEEYTQEDNLRQLRLDGGLEQLHQLVIILLYICRHDSTATSILTDTLHTQYDLTIDHIQDVWDDMIHYMEEYIPAVHESIHGNNSSGSGSGGIYEIDDDEDDEVLNLDDDDDDDDDEDNEDNNKSNNRHAERSGGRKKIQKNPMKVLLSTWYNEFELFQHTSDNSDN